MKEEFKQEELALLVLGYLITTIAFILIGSTPLSLLYIIVFMLPVTNIAVSKHTHISVVLSAASLVLILAALLTFNLIARHQSAKLLAPP